jgi:hypothetical protein
MDVMFLCLHVVLSCVGRSLCEGLIILAKESYHVSYKIKKLKMGGQGLVCAIKAADGDDDVHL